MNIFKQSTGDLFDCTGAVIGKGYSGHGAGVNNPDMQDKHDVGPIPQGEYTIGAVNYHSSHGPLVMPLIPKEGTETFGRSGFLMHGDLKSAPGEHLASLGCIIMDFSTRAAIARSTDRDLKVIA